MNCFAFHAEMCQMTADGWPSVLERRDSLYTPTCIEKVAKPPPYLAGLKTAFSRAPPPPPPGPSFLCLALDFTYYSRRSAALANSRCSWPKQATLEYPAAPGDYVARPWRQVAPRGGGVIKRHPPRLIKRQGGVKGLRLITLD